MSSTIYDFKDLRSAIKYWLEELGLQVELSEATDFSRRPNQDAFRSCFGVIERCDYYVLLVGGRRGQWYVREEVSVTQQEYRTAVDLAKRDRIKIIVLAREQVEGALREWKLMDKPLGRMGRKTKDRLTIEDPEFTDAFLNEIRKTELAARGADPSGDMWIYKFRDFRDVAEVLRNNMQLYGSVARNVLLANLKWELIQNIAAMCRKRADGLPFPGYWYFEDILKEVTLSSARTSPGEQIIHLSTKQASDIIAFAVFGAPMATSIRVAELNSAISSGEFLAYHQSSGRLEPTPALQTMISLRAQLESYQQAFGWWWQTNLNRVVGNLQEGIRFGRPQISEMDLVVLNGMYHWLVNTMRLSISLMDFIADPARAIVIPSLLEAAPYGKEDADRAKAETVVPEDIENWLGFEITRRYLTRDHSRAIDVSELLVSLERFPALLEIIASKQSMTNEQLLASLERTKEFQAIIDAEGVKAALQFLLNSQDVGTDGDNPPSPATAQFGPEPEPGAALPCRSSRPRCSGGSPRSIRRPRSAPDPSRRSGRTALLSHRRPQ